MTLGSSCCKNSSNKYFKFSLMINKVKIRIWKTTDDFF